MVDIKPYTKTNFLYTKEYIVEYEVIGPFAGHYWRGESFKQAVARAREQSLEGNSVWLKRADRAVTVRFQDGVASLKHTVKRRYK